MQDATPEIDITEMLAALTLFGWECEKRNLYDEEAVEGWVWIEPNGTEHYDVGPWDELPPWPDSAKANLNWAIKE